MDELNTGQRREGIYAALVTFARKLSSAVAIFAVSNAIAWAGYITPLEETSGGITRLVEQTPIGNLHSGAAGRLRAGTHRLVAGSLFFAARFPLTSQVHLRLNRLLAAAAGETERPNNKPKPTSFAAF